MEDRIPRYCGRCGSPEIFILGDTYSCESCGHGRRYK